MRPFVAVDIETTGLDPNKHEVIEVGLVSEQGHETFSLEFNPELADPKALEVNGWGQRSFPECYEVVYAQDVLNDWLTGVHLVGKNPQFDAAFLERYLGKAVWHHRLVDVGSMAWGWYLSDGNVWEQPPNVAKVAEMVNIPIRNQHTALDDAKWAWDVFHYIRTGRPPE